MSDGAKKGFEQPDESREIGRATIEMVRLAGASVARITFTPGWRWSTDMKETMATDLCQAHHVGYCLEGGLHVVPDGGGEFDIAPGEAYEIHPGHDAWVTGDANYVGLEFVPQTAESFVSR